jgi:hypothetical protein
VSQSRSSQRSPAQSVGDAWPTPTVGWAHRTIRCAPAVSGAPTGPEAQQSAAPDMEGDRAPDCYSSCPVVHRTVRWCTGLSGAPTGPEAQRSAAPDMEGDRAPDCYSSCPVVHRTVRCSTRQKARIAFQVDLQRLLATLGL